MCKDSGKHATHHYMYSVIALAQYPSSGRRWGLGFGLEQYCCGGVNWERVAEVMQKSISIYIQYATKEEQRRDHSEL